MYVAEFVPTIALFLYHWYEGVLPPLVGVAVNVTEVPAQTAPGGLAVIDTLAVTEGVSVMVALPSIAVVPAVLVPDAV